MNKEINISGVNFLKGICSLWILLGHWNAFFPLSIGFVENYYFIGTSIFIIISGILMTIFKSNEDVCPRDFFKKRFQKLYPLYFLSTFLCFAFFLCGILVDHNFNGYKNFSSIDSLISQLGIDLFLLNCWVPNGSTGLNSASWTFSAIIFFYLFFPYLLKWLSKKNFITLFVFLITINIIYLIPPYLYYNLIPENNKDFFLEVMHKNPIFRLPEFISGIILGKIIIKLQEKEISLNLSSLILIKVGCGLLFYYCIRYFEFWYLHNGMLLIPELLILFLLIFTNLKKITNNFITNFIGSHSFEIYLLHMPFLLLIKAYVVLQGISNYNLSIFEKSIIVLIFLVIIILAKSINDLLRQQFKRILIWK